MKKTFYLSLFFIFSCSFKGAKFSNPSKEKVLLIKAISLQDQADCLDLSYKTQQLKDGMKNFIKIQKEGFYYLQNNFVIINDFIEREEDPIKKIKMTALYEKLKEDVVDRGISIDIQNAPDVFENYFVEFPDLSQLLHKQSNKNLSFYKLYSDIYSMLSTGVESNKIVSILEKNIEEGEYPYGVELQIIISMYITQECSCNITAKEFINRTACVKLIQ